MSRKNLQKEQILLKTGNQTWQATAQTLTAHRERLESALITANAAWIDLYS